MGRLRGTGRARSRTSPGRPNCLGTMTGRSWRISPRNWRESSVDTREFRGDHIISGIAPGGFAAGSRERAWRVDRTGRRRELHPRIPRDPFAKTDRSTLSEVGRHTEWVRFRRRSHFDGL
jgi:hypothetical protein